MQIVSIQCSTIQFLKNTEYNMLESMKINRENVIITNTKYTYTYFTPNIPGGADAWVESI